MVKVLMVCMGNICRSPMAHGYFEHLVREAGLEQQIQVDSAGTHAYHVGNPPDTRAQQTARRRGIDLSAQRARKALREDFHTFDYVLAMDRDNHALLAELCPEGQEHKLRLFLEFAPQLGEREVPDPYYGGAEGFERVFDMVEAAAQGLLAEIRSRHGL
jgi:protein-tyrosine phosphatase